MIKLHASVSVLSEVWSIIHVFFLYHAIIRSKNAKLLCVKQTCQPNGKKKNNYTTSILLSNLSQFMVGRDDTYYVECNCCRCVTYILTCLYFVDSKSNTWHHMCQYEGLSVFRHFQAQGWRQNILNISFKYMSWA